MKKLLASSLLAAAALAATSSAWACDGQGHNTAQNQSLPETGAPAAAAPEAKAKEELAVLSVDELASLLGKGKTKVSVLDANDPQTRAKMGVIPGARLLTSAVRYDAAKELPADKTGKLVFYCANEMCSASHAAARRAVGAGYQDVTVLPAGIKGWRDAGKATDKSPQS